MGTSEEISRRYPRKIELDASLVPPGPQFLRIRPAGQPHQVQPVSLRLMGAADKAAMLQFAAVFLKKTSCFCIAISPTRRAWTSGSRISRTALWLLS